MGIVDSLTAEPEIIEAEKKSCNCNCHENKTPDDIKKEEDRQEDRPEDRPEENRNEEEHSDEDDAEDSEEDVVEHNDETDSESGGDTEEEDDERVIYSPIPDSQIYVVCINNVPYFYAKTLTDAREKARNTLLNMYNDRDRTYQIEEEDSYTMNLTSTYRWFVVSYDTLEATCRIHYVTQITQ
jgi:cobalamin biosynthesis protein CobT